MSPEHHTRIAGTILRVLHPGGEAWPWRALVRPADQDAPVYVKLDISPDLHSGDDIWVTGRMTSSGCAGLPDQLHIARTDAAARLDTILASSNLGFETTHGQDRAPAGLLSLTRAAAMTKEGIGYVGVARRRASRDPAIAWAMGRFSDTELATLRGDALTVIDPVAVMPVRPSRSSWHWGRRNVPRSRYEPSHDDIVRVASLLPAMRTEDERQSVAVDALSVNPRSWRFSRDSGGLPKLPSIIVPHDPVETGFGLWRSLSQLPDGFYPLHTPSAHVRARLSTAHELAHAHEHALDIDYAREEQHNEAECFADALAVMLCLLDGSSEDDIRSVAQARALCVLSGVHTHATGPACVEAIEQARRLGREYGEGRVPTLQVIFAARAIARENAIKNGDDIATIRKQFRALLPTWPLCSKSDLTAAVQQALRAPSEPLQDEERTRRLFDVALEMLQDSVLMPVELASPEGKARAAQCERRDFMDHVAYLRQTGATQALAASLERVDGGKWNSLRDLSKQHHPALAPETQGSSEQAVYSLTPQTLRSRMQNAAAWATLGLKRPSSPQARGPDDALVVLSQPDTIAPAWEGRIGEQLTLLREALAGEHAYRGSVARGATPDLMHHQSLRQAIADAALPLRLDTEIWADLAGLASIPARLLIERSATLSANAIAESTPADIAYIDDLNAVWCWREAMRAHRLWRDGAPGGKRLNWAHIDARGLVLTGLDLAGVDLRHANLSQVDLSGTNLIGADLTDACMTGCRIDNTRFDQANLTGVDLTGAVGSRCVFDVSILDRANLSHSVIEDASLCSVSLLGAQSAGARLVRPDFTGTQGVPAFVRGAWVTLPRGLEDYGDTNSPTARYLEQAGCRKLHCEDDFAIIRPDGSGVAFLEGERAAVVVLEDTDGIEWVSRLLKTSALKQLDVASVFGAGARMVEPTREHFEAIRRAGVTGSEFVPILTQPTTTSTFSR